MESRDAGEIKRKDRGLNGAPSPYNSDSEILMFVRERDGWSPTEKGRETLISRKREGERRGVRETLTWRKREGERR